MIFLKKPSLVVLNKYQHKLLFLPGLPQREPARERDEDNSQSLDLKKLYQPSPSPSLKVTSPSNIFPSPLLSGPPSSAGPINT